MKIKTVLKIMAGLFVLFLFVCSFSGITWLLSQASNIYLVAGVAWFILDIGILIYAGGWVWQRWLRPFWGKIKSQG